MNLQELRRLTDIEAAARALVALHPAQWTNGQEDDMGSGFYECHYCGAEEHFTPDYEQKTLDMSIWLEANPAPRLVQQAIKRKDAPDTAIWDRENSRRHNSYRQIFGAWQRRYAETYQSIWGDPAQHPGSAIDHKEDCVWMRLKVAIDAAN
jgi:hypothetical protein